MIGYSFLRIYVLIYFFSMLPVILMGIGFRTLMLLVETVLPVLQTGAWWWVVVLAAAVASLASFSSVAPVRSAFLRFASHTRKVGDDCNC